MSLLVPIALFGWLLVVPVVFMHTRPSRAVAIAFVFAWMLLPPTGYDLPGLPDYTKAMAAMYSVLLATLICDAGRLFSIRLSAADLPMVAWCLCPFASSLANNLGVYDGVSAVVENTLRWGVPYLLGRIYLRNLSGLRELAVVLVVGGLVYVPFCLFEIRMSPQLNAWIYGFGGSGIEYATELGKWGSRPRVFMENGLTLGMFMTAASLAALWLWVSGNLKRLWGYSAGWLAFILTGTAFACKNMGALVLLLAGVGCLVSLRYLRFSWAVYLLMAAAPLYMMFRGTGKMGGDVMVSMVQTIHERRAASLQVRFKNEDMLVQKAMQRRAFGWGRWGRFRIFDENGKDITLTDGLWVIALGESGLAGLMAVTGVLLIPSIAFARRYPVRDWLHPALAPGGVLAVLLVLYAIDCLFNAMINPIYLLAAGGLVSVATAPVPVPARAAETPNSAPIAVGPCMP